jgi:hypothetical protein
MIKLGEIQKLAHKFAVRDQQIEKDYILSWILQGIARHNRLPEILVFKGGTVLKKAYFENYRFSEDLDFTILDDTISNDQIFNWFTEVFQYVNEEANIPLEIIDNNNHEDGGINFYIGYVGPLGGYGQNKRVKTDISRNELMVFEAVTKSLNLTYSDQEKHQLLCYSLEEILIEKMRSVMQRMQARDFYDIWYLLEIQEMEIDFYRAEFALKCAHKCYKAEQFPEILERRKAQYKGRWTTSLAGQIKHLPEFEQVEREVDRRLRRSDFYK